MNPREETDPPFRVSPEKKITLPAVMLIGLIGSAVSGAIWLNGLQAEVKAATMTANAAVSTGNQHEDRLRALEKSNAQIAEALDWIRRRMEEDRRPGR